MENLSEREQALYIKMCSLSPIETINRFAEYNNLNSDTKIFISTLDKPYTLKSKIIKWFIETLYNPKIDNFGYVLNTFFNSNIYK